MAEQNKQTDEFHDPQQATSRPADLISQVREMFVYKWQIGAVLVIAVAAMAAYLYLQTPTYRATNTLQIKPRQTQVLNVNQVYDTGAGSVGYYATQAAVLRSRDLAEKAAKRVDWSKYPDVLQETLQDNKSLLGTVLGYLPFLGSSDDKAGKAESRQDKLTDSFMAHRAINFVLATQLLKVHYFSSNPELARDAANALAAVYIESGYEAQLQATKHATDWLDKRLGGVSSDLKQSEAKLQDFREKNDLISAGGGGDALRADLSDNMQRLRDARRQKTSLQNTYSKIRQAGDNIEELQDIPVLLTSDLVKATKKHYLSAQQQLSALQSRYGPKHPKIISAKSNLKEARQAYLQQLQNAADGIRSQYQIAAEDERALQKQVDKTRDKLRSLDRKTYKMKVLQRNAQTNSELYDTLLSRFKQESTAGNFHDVRAEVVDPAIVPDQPFLPRKKRMLLIAALVGLFLGTAIALIRRRLDNKIKTGDELEAISGLAVFNNVPAVSWPQARKLPKLVAEQSRSVYAEAIRTIRTGVILSDVDGGSKRLLVTSSVQLEGKSSLSCNLALSFGEIQRVLLVDGDLRRPSLARYLGLRNGYTGLVDVLSGDADVNSAIHPVAEGVDLLPVGDSPPNPGGLITSERFKVLLNELAARYDRIIIDSAPCQLVSETLLLARHADQVLFVVQHDSTPRRIAQTALGKIRQSHIPIVGAVLNRVDQKTASQYGDSHYYYSSVYYG